MKAVVVGGGPAGLYFALLAKKANPSDQITVIERNPPDATFGWGVVFSEETLGALRDADFETYDEISTSFARWNAIDIYYRTSRIRSRGHVFTGISRKVLLNILQRRARQLGVELVFGSEIDRKSTRLNSSHSSISYAVFCLKKKKKKYNHTNRKKKKN